MLLLYPICEDLDKKEIAHLHSTMLLLYLTRNRSLLRLKNIYIPLCFYFIFCIADMILSHILIYIPLCFYFIRGTAPSGAVRERIYIPLCFYFIDILAEYAGEIDDIYIPLCFYFIKIKTIQQMCTSQFTFHYASTLSGIHAGSIRQSEYLHSTMLLLYPYRKLSPVTLIADLHSTMLLLYHLQTTQLILCRLHLHSTMLLLYPKDVSACI